MISIIAAHDDARGIGKDGKLPWRSKYDMKLFVELTMGHSIVMGRKTFESLPKRQPLKGRTNVVITRDVARTIAEYGPYHVPTTDPPTAMLFACDLDDALKIGARFGPEILIIGGAEVYAQALPRADRLYLSHVDGLYSCDVFFPEVDLSGPEWKTVQIRTGGGEDGQPKVTFTEHRRIRR